MTVPKGSLPTLVVGKLWGSLFQSATYGIKNLKLTSVIFKKIDQKLKNKEKKEFNSNL